MIYGVTPKRNYTYNPNNATLYLNVSEEELDDLRKQLTDLQREQQEATGEAADGGEE